MIKPDQFKIADYLNTTFSCSCGKEHSISLKQVELSTGAINKLPTIIQQYGYQKVCVICDTNTYEVAGKKVMGILSQSNIQAKHYMFRSTALVPDEAACGTILSNIDEGTDLIIAVGSGTINDLCKFISYKVGLKYFIVATAPSMDGFASIGAPLIIDKLKVTYDTHSPQVIIGDLDVLCCAPMDMITAGLGDILGKYTCLIDWKIAHIINDEYYCETIVQMVEHSISKVINNASLVKSRDPKVIADIMEALVLTGIAMGFVENSRPASGSEHHISHFWEMRFLFESKPPVPHGTKVGIGTIAILYLYHELKNMQIDFRKANSAAFLFDYEAWENRIKNTYGQAATGVINLERVTNKNAPDSHALRVEVIQDRWSNLMEVLEQSLPDLETIEKLLSDLAAPINPAQVGVDYQTIVDSILVAKEVRNRYTLLQMLWDLGLGEEMASKVANYFKDNQKIYNELLLSHKQNSINKIKCFILDMDGTIYLGNRLFEFTIDFLDKLKALGKDFYFYTNNSSRNSDAYIQKLEKMNIHISAEKMLISNAVIIDYIKKEYPGQSVYVMGTPLLEQEFYENQIALKSEDGDLAVIGFDTTLTYEKLRIVCDMIRSGKPVLGVNPDFNCPVDGGFIPDCGAMAALIQASTGVMPEFFGKPSRHTLDFILAKTGYKEDELAFVGDRLYTDIAITQGTKATSILVLTGETQLEDLENSKFQPTLICNSLEEIGQLLG